MSVYLLYGLALLGLGLSFFKDRGKTKMALKKAWKALEGILPQLLGIILLVGIMLAFFNADTISEIIGFRSGWWGVVLSAVVGAITLIPAFIAFPVADLLLKNGAGYMQIGAFVSSLMMVGVVTIPLEIKHFGKKATLLRNILAFLFSFLVALIIGKVVG